MNKFESPAMTAQATIRASVLKYTALLCKSLEENYIHQIHLDFIIWQEMFLNGA